MPEKPLPLIRTPYDGFAARVSDDAATVFLKDKDGNPVNPEVEARTRQSEKDGCDLNLMLELREGRVVAKNGGFIMSPQGNEIEAADFSEIGDWFAVQKDVAKAVAAFAAQPVAIRNKFANDPRNFYEFLADPANDKEAVEMRLKSPEVLKTALADDGKTRITPEERADLDADKAKKAAANAAAAASGGGPK